MKYLAVVSLLLAAVLFVSLPRHAKATSGPMFPDAAWLYSRPVGVGEDMQYLNAQVTINVHDNGFDYPVQYADGSNGTTTFQDSAGHSYAVPNPSGGFFPSYGGWGANDGHLTVIDTSNGAYYDFWKLYAGGGTPYSDWVGSIVSGSINGEGNPGTTAAGIAGAAGDLMPGELENGIGHALNCVIPSGWNSPWVGGQSAAVKTDGSGDGPMSEGGKLGIAPSVDLNSLGVGIGTLHLMQALQTYGCAVTDQTTGSEISVYSNYPNLDGIDMTGLDQVGRWLRFYF